MFRKFLTLFIMLFSLQTLAGGEQCTDMFRTHSLDTANQQEILDWLHEMNPDSSADTVLKQLANCQNPLDLFRSFVANFFDLIHGDPNMMQSLSPLLQPKGWMFGDTWFGNFGSILLENGKVIYSMTDLDDGGHGSLGLDPVRFITSALLHDPSIDTAQLLNSYIQGLQNVKVSAPHEIQNFLSDAQDSGANPSPSNIDPKTNLILRTNKIIDLDPNVAKSLETFLKQSYKASFDILDGVEVIRDEGGSGGMKRYRFLLNVAGQKILIEFKQETIPGMRQFADENLDIKTRMQDGLHFTELGRSSKYYGYDQAFGDDFLVRPRFGANGNIGLKHYNQDQAVKILNYTAWTLGQLHAKTAQNSKQLQATIANSRSDILSSSQAIAQKFKQIYSTLGNLVGQNLTSSPEDFEIH